MRRRCRQSNDKLHLARYVVVVVVVVLIKLLPGVISALNCLCNLDHSRMVAVGAREPPRRGGRSEVGHSFVTGQAQTAFCGVVVAIAVAVAGATSGPNFIAAAATLLASLSFVLN